MKLVIQPIPNSPYFDVVDIEPPHAQGARVIRAAYCTEAEAVLFASAPRLLTRIAQLEAALDPLAALPADFARHEDQPVFTVLGGPFGETPQAQTWRGNRSIFVRDIKRARLLLGSRLHA